MKLKENFSKVAFTNKLGHMSSPNRFQKGNWGRRGLVLWCGWQLPVPNEEITAVASD